MRAWRLALEKFGATREAAFSGLSGFTVDGRWHARGRQLDYAAESLSLAALERLVHYKRSNALAAHVFYVLDVPDAMVKDVAKVPKGWDGGDFLPSAQALGNTWCDNHESPALRVPSVVTPGERNLLVNARHPDWKWDWVTEGPVPFSFDKRLLD